MYTNNSNSLKLLIISILSVFSYSIGAEAILPIRATSDEALVIPDILTLFETGELIEVGYFSGVGYQLQTTILLKITGLSPDALQLLSPVIAGVAFGVFFTVIYCIYQREVDQIWWGFFPVIVSVVVFPGFVARTWESTHKAYTFIFVFLSIYVTYRAIKSQHDQRFILFLPIFLISIGLFNYLWGIIYSALLGIIVLAFRSTRKSGFIATVAAGMISLITPAVYPFIRYHRSYFLSFKSALDTIIERLTGNGNSNNSATSGTSETSTTTPAPANGTPEPNAVGSSLLNETANTNGGTAVGRATETLGRINDWPATEIIGLTVSTWYIYSLGIGFVAALTTISGFLCVCLFFRRQLSTIGMLTAAVLLFNFLLGSVLIIVGDVATFKRIIVFPGVIGTLFFVIYVSRKEGRAAQPSKQHRHVFLIVITIMLLVTAGLATNRTLVNGGDAPIDNYINEMELNQVEWVSQYGTESPCYFVRQKVVTTYASKIGIGLSTFSANPELINSVYQSSPDDAVAVACT